MQNKIKNPIYYPLLASENASGGVKLPEEIRDIWSRFDALSEERKNILSSIEVPEKMKLLQDTFGCDDGAVEGISVLIRWLFFGQINPQGFQEGIKDVCEELAPDKTAQVLSFIQKEIIELKPKPRVEETEEEERPKAAIMNMPILQALSKYEKLGNQLITEERIRVKSQPEPVRPSLLYWLKYYRDDIGVGHHDSVQRGQFLFRSENGKKLSAEERERVSLILKSVEENFPLAIDTERQEIIFPAFQGVMIGDRKEPAAIPANARIIRGPVFGGTAEEGQRAEKTFASANLNPYENGGLRIGRGTHFGNIKQAEPVVPGAVSFSTSHMFPAEKEAAENTAAQQTETRQAPQAAQQPAPRPAAAPAPKPNPFHIHPVSLGKKK